MSGAEQAVRAKALALLAGDAELAGLVHGVFDGVPARASAPYVSVGGVEGRAWGPKDRAGRGGIGRASWRERGWQEGWVWVVAGSLNTKELNRHTTDPNKQQ